MHGCRNTGPMSLAEFLALPALADLRSLELERGMAPQGLPHSALLPAHLSRLTTLSLPGIRLGDEGLAALAVSPHAANLHTLNVASNNLTRDAVPILVDSPPLANLRWLTLRGNPLGEGLRFLIDSELIERLVWLDLRGTQLEDAHALRLLARAKSLRHLARLDLRRNHLSDDVRRPLRQAFGPTVCYNG